MDNFTQSYQSECRESIKKELVELTSKLPNIKTRLSLKAAKQKMHDYYVDILGRSVPVKQPIFTQNEVEDFKQHQRLYGIVLGAMVFFESAIYSMMANLLLSKQTLKDWEGLNMLIGLAFALIFVVALHFAFKGFFEFFEAKHLIEKEKHDKTKLKPFYTKLIFSIIIFIIFLITNFYTGYIRATWIEGGTASTSPLMAKLHFPLLVFSVMITFLVAFVMAKLEKEIAEKGVKIKVYENWVKQQNERKKYNTHLREMYKNSKEKKDVLIEQYWSVLKDLQRVFEREVDQNQEGLYADLQEKILSGEINMQDIDDKLYQQYLPVAINRFELFRYGINSDPFITEALKTLKTEVDGVDEFERLNTADCLGNEAEITEEDITKNN